MNLLSGNSILNSSFEEPTHTGTVGRGERWRYSGQGRGLRGRVLSFAISVQQSAKDRS